jgi:hypothetical protein
MDRKTFSIGILSLTALILFVACLLPARPAQADFAVKDISRLQLVTVASQKGGNILYVIDPVGGKILVLGYDTGTKLLRPIAASTLDHVFNQQ